MKKTLLSASVILFAVFLMISSCSKEKAADPCDGMGVLNVENKLDSAISVKIMPTHVTKSIAKDYTLPLTLAGNQPYTLTIDGKGYHKDTTMMLLFCDNKLIIVK